MRRPKRGFSLFGLSRLSSACLLLMLLAICWTVSARPSIAQTDRSALVTSLQTHRANFRASDAKLHQARRITDSAWTGWRQMRARLDRCARDDARQAAIAQISSAHQTVRPAERELYRLREINRNFAARLQDPLARPHGGEPNERIASWIEVLRHGTNHVNNLADWEARAGASYAELGAVSRNLANQCSNNSSPVNLIAATGGKYIRRLGSMIDGWLR